jgi:hypothetical protein
MGARDPSCSRTRIFSAVKVFALVLVGLALCACGSSRSDPAPAGTLYLAGAKPGTLTTVDVTRHRVRTLRLRELAPGDPPYMIATVGGRLVVYGHDHTYAVAPTLKGRSRNLGKSWFFVPSATPGRVWLALLDPRTPPTANALNAVREITVTGAVTVARSRRPPAWPLAALRSGLVIQRDTLELWDPVRGRIIRRLPGTFPVAVRGWRLVSCAARCRVLHVVDTRTGARGVVLPPRGARFVESYDGAFSPDGRLVAVPVEMRDGTPHVALVNLQRHRATLVAGPPLARGYPLSVWSSAGWLFYNAGDGRLAAYRAGAAAATLLPVHVPAFVDLAAG